MLYVFCYCYCIAMSCLIISVFSTFLHIALSFVFVWYGSFSLFPGFAFCFICEHDVVLSHLKLFMLLSCSRSLW